jgi:predicted nucleic acid-binding protein
VIVDSYAWVEFLAAGPQGPKVRERLETPGEIVTPDIVPAEVARVFARQGMDPSRIEGHLRSIGALSAIRPVNVEIALETAKADQELRQSARRTKIGPPSFADAIILSFARCLGGKVLTADPHFRGFAEVDWIGA